MTEATFSNADSDTPLNEIHLVFIGIKEEVMDKLTDPVYHFRKRTIYFGLFSHKFLYVGSLHIIEVPYMVDQLIIPKPGNGGWSTFLLLNNPI